MKPFFYLVFSTFILTIFLTNVFVVFGSTTKKIIYKNKEVQKIELCKLFELHGLNQDNSYNIETTGILYLPPWGNAKVIGGPDYLLYSEDCNNKGFFVYADLSKIKPKELLEIGISSKEKESTYYKVTIAGEFNLSASPRYGELGWLRAMVEIENIKSVTLIKTEKIAPPDIKSDSPDLQKGDYFSGLTASVLFYYFDNNAAKKNVESAISKRTVIIVDGKLINNKDFHYKGKIGQLSHRNGVFTRIEDIWKGKGVVVNEVDEKIVTKITYESKFLNKPDNSWELLYLEIITVEEKN